MPKRPEDEVRSNRAADPPEETVPSQQGRDSANLSELGHANVVLASWRGYSASEQEQLIVKQIPAVLAIARHIYRLLPEHASFEAIFDAGVIGMLSAVSKFDPSGNESFSDYAQFQIRGSILESLRTLIDESEKRLQKGGPVEIAIYALTSQYNRAPTAPEISAEMNIDIQTYERLLDELKGMEISILHSTPSDGAGEISTVNLATRPEDDTELRIRRVEMNRRLADAIRELPNRERLILALSYGEGLSLKAIGFVLNEKESGVSRTHVSAILYLRSRLSNLGYS